MLFSLVELGFLRSWALVFFDVSVKLGEIDNIGARARESITISLLNITFFFLYSLVILLLLYYYSLCFSTNAHGISLCAKLPPTSNVSFGLF